MNTDSMIAMLPGTATLNWAYPSYPVLLWDIFDPAKFFIKQDKKVFSLNEYECDNQTMVESFLVSHPSIEKYLKEAPSQIKKYFKNPKLSLAVSIDPEVDNDSGILFVNIATNESVETAWSKLNELTRKWIIPVVGRDASRFNVDIDFS